MKSTSTAHPNTGADYDLTALTVPTEVAALESPAPTGRLTQRFPDCGTTLEY